ncbi:MAG: hypothetical protein AVDCRST_MAG08-2695, partial [uncultured Acetobacteraceae bacterium]
AEIRRARLGGALAGLRHRRRRDQRHRYAVHHARGRDLHGGPQRRAGRRRFRDAGQRPPQQEPARPQRDLHEGRPPAGLDHRLVAVHRRHLRQRPGRRRCRRGGGRCLGREQPLPRRCEARPRGEPRRAAAGGPSAGAEPDAAPRRPPAVARAGHV